MSNSRHSAAMTITVLGILLVDGAIRNVGAGVILSGTFTGGVAWQDSADTWDTIIGNGNPGGTFDYFTVVAQEIGHALGLGHVDNVGGSNLMNGSYTAEVTAASAVDVAHITSVYGSSALVPEPSTFTLLGMGAIGLIGYRRRKQKQAA